MSTFLQLCQSVADESGTGAFPGTVSGLTGRPAKITAWVRNAWVDIQNDRNDWRWMEDTFTGSLLADISTYQGGDFSLTRFGQWKAGRDPDTMEDRFTVHLASQGRAREAAMHYEPWNEFRARYDRGAAAEQTGTPTVYTVDNLERLRVWPVPTASCTIRGVYRKTPQELTAGTDVPEMPAQYHSAIVWRALTNLAAHDEAFNQPAYWNTRYLDVLNDMERTQLPMVRLAGPLA